MCVVEFVCVGKGHVCLINTQVDSVFDNKGATHYYSFHSEVPWEDTCASCGYDLSVL